MPRKDRILSLVLLAALVLALVLAPGSPSPGALAEGESKLDDAWWARTESFVRRVMDVPRSVKLELKRIGPAGTPEFRIVTLEAREGEEVRPFLFYASADGTKIIVDRLYDLSQDPFARNRERIRLERVPSRGAPAARLTIVEYSDYTCPWCQRFFLTLEKPLLERYAGQVRYVYKQYPLSSRAGSQDVALAAACAFRQGNEAFWTLHERLFLHRARLTEKGILLQLAQGLPLDLEKFETCLERREALADVQRDVAEGESLGVSGTPTFFINGRPLHGLPSRERFLEIVEEELALAPAAPSH